MFANKYLNFGYLSVFSVILGIVMSVTIVKTAYSFESKNEKLSISEGHEVAESNIEKEDAKVEEQGLTEGNIEEEIEKVEEREEITIFISGMTISECEATIKAALMKCFGVRDARVSHKDANALVNADVNEVDYYEIITVVEDAGFFVEAID